MYFQMFGFRALFKLTCCKYLSLSYMIQPSQTRGKAKTPKRLLNSLAMLSLPPGCFIPMVGHDSVCVPLEISPSTSLCSLNFTIKSFGANLGMEADFWAPGRAGGSRQDVNLGEESCFSFPGGLQAPWISLRRA